MYTWYLDLDELERLGKKHPILIGINRARVYTFRDKDHFRFWSDDEKKRAAAPELSLSDAEGLPGKRRSGGTGKPQSDARSPESDRFGNVRRWVNHYFREKELPVPHKVFLLTNLRYLGYGFNPVSFYFALDKDERLYAILAEVNNTFGEQKPYLIILDQPVSESEDKRIFARAWKNFYVSPFIDRDREFVFRMKLPSEKLSLGIDTYEGATPILRAAYSGTRKPIATSQMLSSMARFPLVTLKVIVLIHWHALRLFLKKVPYFGKDDTDVLIQKDEHKRKEVTHATV
tara:strand:+ start:262023 stop:262886 length:864 start_codon:yes stop_codon:yes gene_type:complete